MKVVHREKPTLFIYDSYQGSIGLSKKIYKRWAELLEKTAEYVENCYCDYGCPVYIEALESEGNVKEQVVSLLRALTDGG